LSSFLLQKIGYPRHVLQDLVEQALQELEELTRRFDPPPIPKEDRSFRISELRQDLQRTALSPSRRTSASKRQPH
jgi:hypothetical protein